MMVTATAPVRLYGRDVVERQIERWFKHVEDGAGDRILLTGPPAIGRTHVLAMIVQRAAQRGLPTTVVTTPEQLEQAMFSPHVICLDDIERCSRDFDSLVRARAAQVRGFPVLFVAALATATGSKPARFESNGFEIVELGPLDDAAISLIVTECAADNGTAISDSERSRIVASACGFPRHAVELARHPAQTIPPTVQAAIENFARLNERDAARLVGLLAVTAIANLRPDIVLCAAIDQRYTPPVISAALQAAINAGLCEPDGTFGHPLVRDGFIAYLGPKALELHRACAEQLVVSAIALEKYGRIGDHFAAGGRPNEAHDHYIAMVNDDLAHERYEAAIPRLRRITALDGLATAQLGRAHARLGEAYAKLGDLTVAVEHFMTAARIFQDIDDVENYGPVAVDAARTLIRIGDLRVAQTFCANVFDRLQGRPFDYTQGMLLLMLASMAFARQDEAGSRRIFATLDAHEAHWPQALQTSVYRMRGLNRALSIEVPAERNQSAVFADFDRSIAAADEAGDLAALSAAYDTLSYVQIMRSELPLAQTSAERALDYACAAGDRVKIVRAQAAIMRVASLRGELGRVLAMAGVIAETADQGGFSIAESTPVVRAALLLEARSQLEVIAHRDRFERVADAGDLVNIQDYAAAYALVLLYHGDESRAAAVADRAVQQLQRLDVTEPDLLFVTAQYASAASVTKVRTLLAKAAPILHARLAAGTTGLFEALCARREGDVREAKRRGSNAAAEFRRFGWRWFEMRALRVASRIAEAQRLESEMGAAAVTARADSTLSAREQTIAVLAARGDSNRDIAQALQISDNTVRNHLLAIYRKLGIRSRHQIADALAVLQP